MGNGKSQMDLDDNLMTEKPPNSNMSDQIRETALEWAKAIESRFPENVLRFYHPEGSLWGTLSPTHRLGYRAIFEYFVKFLSWEDLKCEFQEGVARVYDNFAFYSGAYTFTWSIKGKKVIVPARFSFVYKKEGNNWLIMEHHSSLFPDQPFRIRKYIVR
jgi:hypothetical protein